MSACSLLSVCRFCLILGAAAWSSAAAECQLDQAHTAYRATTASQASTAVFQTKVDLVLLTVTVLDRDERAVSGLRSDSFRVLEDNTPQTIKYFSSQDEPIALTIVLDASASMAAKFEDARHALLELIDNSNPQDDFNVIVVGDTPRVALDSSDSLEGFRQAVASIQPDGQTALWDGIVLGVKQLRSLPYSRKAMIVISDGGDNHSRTTESKLRLLLKEADVEVYAIAMFDPYASRREERMGPLQLDEVTSVTGGRVLSVYDTIGISRAVMQIDRELRDQYVIGYYASHQSRNGKWHKVKVNISGQPMHEKFRLYAKKGYYGPAE